MKHVLGINFQTGGKSCCSVQYCRGLARVRKLVISDNTYFSVKLEETLRGMSGEYPNVMRELSFCVFHFGEEAYRGANAVQTHLYRELTTNRTLCRGKDLVEICRLTGIFDREISRFSR